MLAALSLAVGPVMAAPAIDWPAVPLPPGSRGERVTDHMKNNGLDMRASRFATAQSIDEVVRFYQQEWPDRNVVDTLGSKTIVGHAQGDYYVTITLSNLGGATQGTVGTMKMPTGEIDYVMGGGFDKPPNTKVFNDLRYYDTPSESRTLGMVNGLSPYQNYQYYARRLPAGGWRLQKGQKCTLPAAACVAVFEKGDGRMAITLERTADSRTRTVVNIE